MSQIAFLFDEQVPTALAAAVKRLEPAIEVMSVGQPDAPPKGTPDPEILAFAAEVQAVVVSFDKATMVGFAEERRAAGLKVSGLVVITSDQASLQKVAEDLVYIWSASTPDEWENVLGTEYIPY